MLWRCIEFFGEALAALELRGGFGGAEDTESALLELVDDAQVERHLRSDHDQVDA